MNRTRTKRLNYLGYPISQNAHYGNFAEMRGDPVLYLARTCQASMNLQALFSEGFAKAWRFNLLEVREHQPDVVKLRSSYDAAFKIFYKHMQTELPNGMTLEAGCLQLRPKKLQEELSKLRTTDVAFNMLLGVALKLASVPQAVAASELAAIEEEALE